MNLVTAPFIEVIRLSDGRSAFRRLDSQKYPKVIYSDIINEIFEYFSEVKDANIYFSRYIDKIEVVNDLINNGYLINVDNNKPLSPSVELEITNFCNANCIMCPREELRPLGKMDSETFNKFLSLLEEINCSGIIIQGIGEPLLHKELASWIKDIRKILPREKPLVVVSNGSFLSKERLRELFDAGLTHVQVSFHSLDENVYNHIMGKNLYSKVKDNLISCIEEFPEKISINVVEMKNNEKEIESIKEYFTELGLPVKAINIIPCFSRGGSLKENLYKSRGKKSSSRCTYVLKSMFISWNGDLLPCSNDIRGENVLANLNSSTVKDIKLKWLDLVQGPLGYNICKLCDKHVKSYYTTEWFNTVSLK